MPKSFKIIGITSPSIKRILETGVSDALALYVAYYEIAEWQDTYRVYATSGFMMKRLNWGRDRFAKAKNTLLELEIIKDYNPKDPKTGVSTGWYVEISHLVDKDYKPLPVKAPLRQVPSGDKVETSAYKDTRSAIKEIEVLRETESSLDAGVNPQPPISNKPENDPRSGASALFTIPGFTEAWDLWKQYRKERNLTTTQLTYKMQIRALEKYPKVAIATLEQSIANGWQGLFPQKIHNEVEPRPREMWQLSKDEKNEYESIRDMLMPPKNSFTDPNKPYEHYDELVEDTRQTLIKKFNLKPEAVRLKRT